MKKLLSLIALALVVGTAHVARADYYFEDVIEYWDVNGVTYDSVYIDEHPDWSNLLMPNTVPAPFTYTHDINDEVDFESGDLVTEAYLELDFTDFDVAEWGDSSGSINCFWFSWSWDNSENVSYAYDEGESSWVEVSADNDIQTVVLNIDWLNEDGELDVTINLSNSTGTADIGLDSSKLYGTAVTPVPEPNVMLLIGVGVAGFAAVSRRRR